MRLNISEKYCYIDKDEVQWTFSYQSLDDDEGWFAWITRPGQVEFCVGKVSEQELIDRIERNPPLTSDDLIDLELWMKSGGLDQYQPKKEV